MSHRPGPTSGLALLLGLTAAAGCSVTPTGATPGTTPSSAVVTTSSPTAGPSPSAPSATGPARSGSGGAVPADPVTGEPRQLADGLDVPWGLSFLPDGSALVAERDTGRILRLASDGTRPTEVAVLPDVVADGEGGLLGLAVSPGYDGDGWIYAYVSGADGNRIIRFRLDAASTRPQDSEVVLGGIDSARIHNGGRIAFGPDGLLYAGTGDAGDTSVSQDPADLNGKILRMTPTGEPAPGNPIDGSVVFSVGHRNVQGLAWDSQGRLWATEFGQNTVDEVNLIEAGRNYGWPDVEGIGDTDDGRFTDPRVTWATSDASPSGAAVVATPDGDVLYVAALRGQRLWRIPLDTSGTTDPVSLLDGRYGRLRTVATAPDGSLWLTTSNTDGYGEGRDGDDRVLRFAPPATR